MSKGVIAAIVVGSIVVGLMFGVVGTAIVGTIGGHMADRGAIMGRARAVNDAPWAGGNDVRSGRGMMAGRAGMMGGRGSAYQGAPNGMVPPHMRGLAGGDSAACQNCGGCATGTVPPGWTDR